MLSCRPRLPRGISRCSRSGGVSQPPAQQGPKRTRSAQCGVASALCAVLLLLPLVFILETQPARVDISAFGAHGHLRSGVALLLAGVLGMLLAVIEALGRRMQQRNAAPKSPDLTPSAAPHEPAFPAMPAAEAGADEIAGQ